MVVDFKKGEKVNPKVIILNASEMDLSYKDCNSVISLAFFGCD